MTGVVSAKEVLPMLVCSCPKCGAPVRLELGSATVVCQACGFSGAPPAEVAQAMRAAGAVLQSLDARGRQLDARQRRTLGVTGDHRILLLLPSLLVAFPMTVLAALGVAFTLGGPTPDWAMLPFYLLPISVVLAAEVLAFRAVSRRRRELLAACAAVPPTETGGACACHLCGAPLQGSSEAVVRCSWCSADNVVAPALLAKLGARKALAMDRLEEETRAGAARVSAASKGAAAAVLGAGCLAPMLSLGLLFAALAVTSRFETPVKPDEQFALVQTSGGRCIAKVTRFTDHVRVSYGGAPQDGFLPFEDRASAEGMVLESASLAKGRVRIHQQQKTGTVEKVYSHPMQGNFVRVRLDEGGQVETSPQGLCLLE